MCHDDRDLRCPQCDAAHHELHYALILPLRDMSSGSTLQIDADTTIECASCGLTGPAHYFDRTNPNAASRFIHDWTIDATRLTLTHHSGLTIVFTREQDWWTGEFSRDQYADQFCQDADDLMRLLDQARFVWRKSFGSSVLINARTRFVVEMPRVWPVVGFDIESGTLLFDDAFLARLEHKSCIPEGQADRVHLTRFIIDIYNSPRNQGHSDAITDTFLHACMPSSQSVPVH